MVSPAFEPPPGALHSLYDRLIRTYGAQAWWPADTPFEVMVGAVLTQNAAWVNVEKAIENLKRAQLLSLQCILDATHTTLADCIRPSGYYNVKARRLQNLCAFIAARGGLDAFARHDSAQQRAGLLSVNGIGPETADDILLYALDRPVFVIDAYTRRLLQRAALAGGDEPYEELRAAFERELGPDVELFKEYHALIVMHAKAVCRKTPLCADCMLADSCPTGRGHLPGGA